MRSIEAAESAMRAIQLIYIPADSGGDELCELVNLVLAECRQLRDAAISCDDNGPDPHVYDAKEIAKRLQGPTK